MPKTNSEVLSSSTATTGDDAGGSPSPSKPIRSSDVIGDDEPAAVEMMKTSKPSPETSSSSKQTRRQRRPRQQRAPPPSPPPSPSPSPSHEDSSFCFWANVMLSSLIVICTLMFITCCLYIAGIIGSSPPSPTHPSHPASMPFEGGFQETPISLKNGIIECAYQLVSRRRFEFTILALSLMSIYAVMITDEEIAAHKKDEIPAGINDKTTGAWDNHRADVLSAMMKRPEWPMKQTMYGARNALMEKDTKVPPGIVNRGVSCYMNSTLQLLRHSMPLMRNIAEFNKQIHSQHDEQCLEELKTGTHYGMAPLDDVTNALKENTLVYSLLRLRDETHRYFPNEADRRLLFDVSVLRSVDKVFEFENNKEVEQEALLYHLQHDASEFLGYCLDHLQTREAYYLSLSRQSQFAQEGKLFDLDHSPIGFLKVFDKFHFVEDEHDWHVSEPKRERNMILPLPIGTTTDEINDVKLVDLLHRQAHDDGIVEELTDGNYVACDLGACKGAKNMNYSREKLMSTRDLFIISLGRFDNWNRKVKKRVHFPCRFKLGDSVYALYFVIIHIGSGREHGHYYAYGRSSDDAINVTPFDDVNDAETKCQDDDGISWFKYDDEKVTKSSFTTIENLYAERKPLSNETPYILAYTKVPQN